MTTKAPTFSHLMPQGSGYRQLIFDALGEWLRHRPGASLELSCSALNDDTVIECVVRSPAGRDVVISTHLQGWNGETYATLARACEVYETRHDAAATAGVKR